MEGFDRLTLMLLLSVVVCKPVDSWYKQAAGPSYYSVGRASGLLSGIRRSEPAEPLPDINSPPLTHFKENFFKNMAVCVRDLSPDLQSCEFMQDSSTFQCSARVIFSLDSRDCLNA